MRAMVLRKFAPVENRPLESADMEAPRPGEHEILIRVRFCAVCHTDLHTVEGELPDVVLPVVPGHQVVGMVEEAGSRAELFRPGERVGAAWLHSACGACEFCRMGKENLCPQGRFTGYHTNGGYAEYMIVNERFAYNLPEDFPDEEAAPLLCAGIVGYRALRLSGIKPGGRLGLYGFGASAHVAIQVAKHWGCDVYVFSRSRDHRHLAEDLGACWTGTSADHPPAKLQAAVIFAPSGSLVPAALENLERGGTLALAGIAMTPIAELDYQKHLYQERVLRSVANATRMDGQELLQIASEIPVRTKVRLFPLEKANQALLLVKKGKINGAAVLKVS